LRIASWNVNGLRAIAKKGFAAWRSASAADFVGLQETRCQASQAPPELLAGWHTAFVSAERKGYSGCGVFSRRPLDEVRTSLGVGTMDREARVQIARIGSLSIANVYFPNGSGPNRDHSRVAFKLRFYRRLFKTLDPLLKSGEPVVVMGDFNTAIEDIDLARPRPNRTTSGFLDRERKELKRWLKHGWVDSYRVFDDSPGKYTWWSQRKGVRERNVGWRIDLALVSPGALPFLRSAEIHPEVLGSDHCPISLDLDDAVLGV